MHSFLQLPPEKSICIASCFGIERIVLRLFFIHLVSRCTFTFMQIIVAFYLIGMLKDRQITSYSTLSVQFLILCITMVLLIVKSFWGLTIQPFYNVQGAKIFAAVVSLILKIGVVIALTLCMNNAGDLAHQRDLYFYKGQTKVTSIEPEPVMQDNIWESQIGNM